LPQRLALEAEEDELKRVKSELVNMHVPENLYLVCGALDLDMFTSSLEGQAQRSPDELFPTPFYNIYNSLRALVGALNSDWIVVMDTNPSFSLTTRLALIACEELIIPSTIDEFAGGGLRSLLLQLGLLETGGGLVSFAKMVHYKQDHEKNTPHNIFGVYEYLPIAKFRALVVNRHPHLAPKPGKVKGAIVRSFAAQLAEAYEIAPEKFADPHLPPGKQLPEDAQTVVDAHYLQVVDDIGQTIALSQNLGFGLTNLHKKTYDLRFCNIESEVGILGADAAAYCMQIQDLVELSLHSSRDKAYELAGLLRGGKKRGKTNVHQWHRWSIIAPSEAVPGEEVDKDATPIQRKEAKMRGRRLAPTFRTLQAQWKPNPNNLDGDSDQLDDAGELEEKVTVTSDNEDHDHESAPSSPLPGTQKRATRAAFKKQKKHLENDAESSFDESRPGTPKRDEPPTHATHSKSKKQHLESDAESSFDETIFSFGQPRPKKREKEETRWTHTI